MNPSAQCYAALLHGKPVAFCAVMHFPHPRATNIKRIHRIVTLPDYQGIGIGTRLLNVIAQKYKAQGYRVRIVTSTPALKYSLPKQGWIMTFNGRQVGVHEGITGLNDTISSMRITKSFEYVGVSPTKA